MEEPAVHHQAGEAELAQEEVRQEKNNKLRKEFAQHANAFYSWLMDMGPQRLKV